MSKPKKVKTQDYSALARQDAATAMKNWQTNVQTARPNQVGPQGTRNWAKDAQGNWTETVAMTPDRQNLYDTTNQKAQQQLEGYDTSQVDLSKAPGMPTVGGYNQQAIDTVRALQAPDLERRANADRARRTAMGLGEATGQAWNSGEQNLNDAASRADMQAILAGINQGNTEFGQGMQLHTTGTGDILNQQTANNQKVGGMMGQSNNFTMPTFKDAPTPGMPGAVNPNTVEGAMKMDQIKAQNAAAQSKWKDQLLGTAGTIAGSFFGPAGAMIGGKLASGIGGMMGGGGGGGGGDSLWMPTGGGGGYTAPEW